MLRPSQTRDVSSLIDSVNDGGAPSAFLFFWGHQPPKDGSVGKSCFSQWYPASFSISGTTYSTAEHYMMAEKARLFGDAGIANAILAAKTPAEAKKLGRQIAGFDESIWLRERMSMVVAGNMANFRQNEELGAFLLKTGERVLVEASPVDRIWGIGLAADHPDAHHPARWQGLNLLGFALMEVRAQLLPVPPGEPLNSTHKKASEQ
jgi:hypothetical protein